MSHTISDKIEFLRECDRYSRKIDEYRERLQTQKMGHMDRVLASKTAYMNYKRTGDPSEIKKLLKLGVWVDTPL